jgi:cob(I)alamin adenosyltransferase
MSGTVDVVILDEINCVMDKKLVDVNEIVELIKNKPRHVELILTGRGAPEQILDVADYVSEIRRVKHPYDKGILARKGIEF